MALTTKPTSTVSYNTEKWLKTHLDALHNEARIADYRYIWHKGESGDKDHFHVWIEPSRRIDTEDLRKYMEEPDPMNPGKPLGCMPFRRSDEDNWLMYALHDPEYLENHPSDESEEKEPYTLDCIVTPYPEALMRTYRRAVRLRRTDTQRAVDALMEGQSPLQVAYTMGNPFAVNTLARLLTDDKVRRWKEPMVKQAGEYISVDADAWKFRNEKLNVEGSGIMTTGDLMEQVVELARKRGLAGLTLDRVYTAFEGDVRAIFVDKAGVEHRYFLTIKAGELTDMEERV